ncbi:MAG: cupin domain-containing protein [Dehalococcoidia bacterium]
MARIILGPGEGATVWLGTTETSIKVDRALSNGLLFMAEHVFAPGFEGPPAHIHPDMDHTFYVVEGTARFVVDGQESTGGPGTSAFVSRGTPHTWGNASDTPARLIEINVPGGFEEYYAELSRALPQGAPPDPETIRGIMQRHGILPA